MKDVLLLVAGAIVGIVLDRATTFGVDRSRAARTGKALQRFAATDESPKIAAWLIDHLTTAGATLYTTTTTAPEKRLPLVVSHDGISDTAGASIPLDFVSMLPDPIDPTFEIDEVLIDHRRSSGANIFPGELAIVRALSPGPNPELTVGRCDYYAFATRVLRLEIEAAAAARGRNKTPLLDKSMTSWEKAFEPVSTLIGVGCAAVTLLARPGGPQVLMHRRSDSVVAYPGARSVVPAFGVERHTKSGRTSRHGLLKYNYLREFAEELLDLEAIVQASRSSHFGPDWVLSLDAMPEIEAQFDTGEATLDCIGIALDPRSTSLIVALLARFDSLDFCDQLLDRLKANWESSNDEGGSLELVDLWSSQIDGWIAAGEVGTGAAFAIDRARVHCGRSAQSA